MPFPVSESLKQAIRDHFKRRKLEWTEDWFTEVIKSSERKYDIYWSVLALRDCGTSLCVPALKSLLTYPMQDVKCCALLTIAHIAGPSETIYYAEKLFDKTYREKAYAMWAIRDAADHRAIDFVLEYLHINRSKWKRGKMPQSSLPDALQYLSAFYDTDTRIPIIFKDVTDAWDQLVDGERKELSKRISFFSLFQQIQAQQGAASNA